MNQILFTKDSNHHIKYIKNKKYLKSFKLLLFLSLFLILCSFSYFLYFSYHRSQKEKLSRVLLSVFNIEHLYSDDDYYTTVKLNENSNFFVIGLIEIPKINLRYTILSDTSNELLKISPCRFYGPYPNKVGNLCIAGHNYNNDKFFGNLYKLYIGDSINIYDSNNSCIVYYIYDKFEISESNTSCTNQDTDGKREITLVTCNNINKNRLVIKAKE